MIVADNFQVNSRVLDSIKQLVCPADSSKDIMDKIGAALIGESALQGFFLKAVNDLNNLLTKYKALNECNTPRNYFKYSLEINIF